VNPAQHAERALLGSLLTEPSWLTDVQEWLLPSDFGTARHRLTYEVILTVSGRGVVASAEAVFEEARVTEDARHNDVDGGFLQTLMASSPVPARAAIYGRMVVESSIHRTVAAYAARLGYAAVTDGATDVVAANIIDHVEAINSGLAEVETRWPAPVPSATSAPSRPSRRSGTVPAEATLVASLLYYPSQLPEVSSWLEPSDISHPGLRETYAAMVVTHARGDPVDPMTVLWETHRRRGLQPRKYAADDLIRLSQSGLPGFAANAGRDVLLASLRRHAAHAAGSIGWNAMRPELDPPALVAAARRDLQSAQDAGHRWQKSIAQSVR